MTTYSFSMFERLRKPSCNNVLFVLEFYGPVNNEVMSSQSVNSGTVPGQAKTF